MFGFDEVQIASINLIMTTVYIDWRHNLFTLKAIVGNAKKDVKIMSIFFVLQSHSRNGCINIPK